MYEFDPLLDVLNAAWPIQARSDAPAAGAGGASGVQAPVDVVFSETGIRLRHLPGAVNFGARWAGAPPIALDHRLVEEVSGCLSGASSRVTVLKAVPRAGTGTGGSLPCPACGDAMPPSALDCALGHHAELVVERVAGHWCWSCRAGSIDSEAEPRRRLERWHFRMSGETIPSFVYDTAAHPRSIQLELTTRCNLACGYCSNRLIADPRDADFDQLVRLLDGIDLPVVDQIELTGLGETLLHPRLLDIVRELRRRSAATEIGMVTNGVSLTRGRMAPLIDAGISRVCVSVDTLDPDRFSRLRPGTRLEKILANVEDLARFRDEQASGHFGLRLHAVITDDLFGQAKPLIDYSMRHGLDFPVFTPLDPREATLGLYDADQLEVSRTTAAEFETFYTWVVKRWFELGGSINVADRMKPLHERPVTPARRAEGFHHSGLENYPSLWLCKWAIDKCYIASEGSLLSCCNAMTDIPRHALADLRRQTLREIWGCDLLWAYRLPLALDLLPPGCLGCDQAPPRGRPMPAP